VSESNTHHCVGGAGQFPNYQRRKWCQIPASNGNLLIFNQTCRPTTPIWRLVAGAGYDPAALDL
jgi:hypothetical protein